MDSLERAGQAGVAARARSVPDSQREEFLSPLRGASIEEAVATVSAAGGQSSASSLRAEDVSAPPMLRNSALGATASEAQAWRDAAHAALGAGRVGVVLVAGGMGTRLGWDAPKGTFPVGPVSQRCLFEVFAQQLRGIEHQVGHKLPWAIQTSRANHEATVAYFQARHHFGLTPSVISFFPQGELPAFRQDGQMALTEDGQLITLPDGHGGVYRALENTGTAAWLADCGVEHVFYFQVDNPLTELCEPEFLGAHLLSGSEMSTTVISKAAPEESLGVLAMVRGQLQVIEYTEMPRELASARDGAGELLLRAANTGIHAFSLDFLRRVGRGPHLPMHIATKPIPCGPAAAPESRMEPGYKLECFVFDALASAERSLVFEVPRQDFFAPVKSKTGAHSPEAARLALSNKHRRQLAARGQSHLVPSDATFVEVDFAALAGPGLSATDIAAR
jgi:UDP-N-acetylglucosamine/UDP-N-acetylgalactosamine diphosphorylase